MARSIPKARKRTGKASGTGRGARGSSVQQGKKRSVPPPRERSAKRPASSAKRKKRGAGGAEKSRRLGRSEPAFPRHAGKHLRRPRSAPPAPLVRTSERISYGRCAWQWDRSYNDRLTPVVDAPALRFGSLIHAALEQRYPPGIKRGPKPAPVFEKLFDKELAEAESKWGFYDSDGEWGDAKHLGVSMLEHYIETYGRDEDWNVIASEMTFKVPVYSMPYPDDTGGFLGLDGRRYPTRHVIFWYVGTMDGVWQNRMDEGTRINDYKTTKGDPEKEAQGKYLLDEQGNAYWKWGVDHLIAEKILKPRQLEALDGMLYTFLRKQGKDMRPQNAAGLYLNQPTKAQQEEGEPGDVSKKQPGKFFHRELVYRDEIQQGKAEERAIQQVMEMYQRREGAMPIFKTPGTGYPDQQCKACPFFDLCELDEMGQGWHDLAHGTTKSWNPYDAHEVREADTRS